MSNIYVFSQRGQLSKTDEHLLYKDKDGSITMIFEICRSDWEKKVQIGKGALEKNIFREKCIIIG